MGLAGRLGGLVSSIAKSKLGQKLAANGGKDILISSIPGAALTAGLTTIGTGNPVAGLAVGLADLGLGYGTSRAIGKYAPKYAGKYRSYVEPEQIEQAKLTRGRIPVSQLQQVYEPSVAQHAAMITSSVAAPLLIEPMFMPAMPQEQYAQQNQVSSQSVTQLQQLAQEEEINGMYEPYTADGTLYQLQGLPYRQA